MTNNNESNIETNDSASIRAFKEGSFAHEVIKVFSKGNASGAWVTNDDFIVGFNIGLDGKNTPVISIHDNKHHTDGHSIALYLEEDGSPMLQACLGKRSERINLLEMISFIKTIMPTKKEDNNVL